MSDHPQVPERIAYSITETGMLLNSGRTTIYALIASGELESIQIGGSRRIPREAIVRLVNRRLAQSRPVDAELSQKKAEAGRRGRASQLAKAVA